MSVENCLWMLFSKRVAATMFVLLHTYCLTADQPIGDTGQVALPQIRHTLTR